MDVVKGIPIVEQALEERAKNLKEVCLGYTEEEAGAETSRRLNCKNPHCAAEYPVSVNIPASLQQVTAGRGVRAAGITTESSALSAVYGHVCPRGAQYEGVCIRGIKGEPVAIGRLERYVANWARRYKLEPENHSKKGGQRVAVIGAGPAEFTCVGDLAKLGCEAKISEALYEPGGVPVYGIPEFRLPKDTVVAHEAGNIRKPDVETETNTIVGKSVSVDNLLDKEGHGAVFIGSGAGLPMFTHVPGETASGVSSASESSTRNNLMKTSREDYDTSIFASRHAIVADGGDVAMDAVRTTLRPGAGIHIVYRRSETELPACAEEVHHTKEEGVIFDLLANPAEILQDENGWIHGVRVIHIEFGELDQSGKRRPVEIPGFKEEIPTGTVIMALGTSPNPLLFSTTEGLETNCEGCLIAGKRNSQITREGVFAGENVVIGAATVILAMGAGKQVAHDTGEYLRSKRARL